MNDTIATVIKEKRLKNNATSRKNYQKRKEAGTLKKKKSNNSVGRPPKQITEDDVIKMKKTLSIVKKPKGRPKNIVEFK